MSVFVYPCTVKPHILYYIGLKPTFDACRKTTVELVDLLTRYYRAPDEVSKAPGTIGKDILSCSYTSNIFIEKVCS